MKRSVVLSSALAAAFLFAGAVAAQQPPGGGRAFGGGGMGGLGGLSGMLRFSKPLQDELKMDKEQVDKLTESMSKITEDLRDTFAKLRDATPEERTEIMKKMAEANNKAVESVLKPDQVKRLHQIENQQAGVGMYVKADVQKSLKITDDQKSKIESINSQLQKDLRELSPRGGGFGGGAGGGFGRQDPQVAKKREALQKEATEKIMDVLDDTQRGLVKDLTGEPFDTRNLFAGAFGGGGGGFGGPGGGGFGGGGFAIGQPGQILPTFLQDQLKLSEEQKKAVEALQKETETKLEKILSEEQNKQLKEMRSRRPGGFGGPGGAPARPGGGTDR